MLANKTSSLQFSDWEWDREQEKIENALVPNPKKRERAISQTMSLITNITYMCMNECTNVHTTYFPVWLSDVCCIQIFCCYSFASSFFGTIRNVRRYIRSSMCCRLSSRLGGDNNNKNNDGSNNVFMCAAGANGSRRQICNRWFIFISWDVRGRTQRRVVVL